MSKIFYKLGKMAAPSVHKAKWIWRTVTNSQAEAIKAEYEVGKDMACDVRHSRPMDQSRRRATVRLAGMAQTF